MWIHMCFPCRFYIMQTKITLGSLPESRASEQWLLQFPRMAHNQWATLRISFSTSRKKSVLVRNLEGQGQNLVLVWERIHSCWLPSCVFSLLELFLIKKIRDNTNLWLYGDLSAIKPAFVGFGLGAVSTAQV